MYSKFHIFAEIFVLVFANSNYSGITNYRDDSVCQKVNDYEIWENFRNVYQLIILNFQIF